MPKGRAYENQIRMSGIPMRKTLEDFDFQPSIDKRQILELATMRFLENAENVVFLGPPGVGKTPSPPPLASSPRKTAIPPIASTDMR